MSAVCAVVVTYNRRDLLRECLTALRAQSRPVDQLVVVDNASEDGTVAMVRAEFGDVELIALDSNTGGAGGFHAGLEHGLRGPGAWFWILDDDTVPEPDALAALLAARERLDHEPALLSSRVLWTDGSLHPMNAPWPRWTRPEVALEAIEHGLLEVRAATYVSILVSRGALERRGLPHPDFFIWGDDVEFTARLLREETGYYVPESVVLHKTKTNYSPAQSDSERYAFDVRNKIWMIRGDGWTTAEKLWWASLGAKQAVQYLAFNRLKPRSFAVVARGLRDGLLRTPA